MGGREPWIVVVAVCAPVAVVLAMCGWVSARVSPTASGCTPPAGEDALIARYRADPLLPDTYPASATPRAPFVRRYCDNVGVEHRSYARRTSVDVGYQAAGRRPDLSLLSTRVQPRAAAAGWALAGYTDEPDHASIDFCKRILGVQTLASIEISGRHDGAFHGYDVSLTSAPDLGRCPALPAIEALEPLGGASLRGLASEGAPVRWALHMHGRLSARAVIGDGVVYAATARPGVANAVYALDAATGAARWRTVVAGAVSTGLAAVDGVVYVAASLGSVYALDAGTGRVRWTTMVPVGRNYAKEWSGAASAPVVGGGGVFVGGADGEVYALDAATGATRWHTAFGGGDGGVGSVPAFADGRVFIATSDGRVAALDSATGALRWRHSVTEVIAGSPHLVDGYVFVRGSAGTDQNVYALDPATGEVRWQHAPIGLIGSLVSTGEWPLTGVAGTGYGFAGLPSWQLDGLFAEASTAVAGGLVYAQGISVGSGEPVGAWDATTGQPRWRAWTAGVPVVRTGPSPGGTDVLDAAPATGSGIVCFGTAGGPAGVPPTDGNLYAFDAPDAARTR
jgi:outer membrane protein assembly factor BamB